MLTFYTYKRIGGGKQNKSDEDLIIDRNWEEFRIQLYVKKIRWVVTYLESGILSKTNIPYSEFLYIK